MNEVQMEVTTAMPEAGDWLQKCKKSQSKDLFFSVRDAVRSPGFFFAIAVGEGGSPVRILPPFLPHDGFYVHVMMIFVIP